MKRTTLMAMPDRRDRRRAFACVRWMTLGGLLLAVAASAGCWFAPFLRSAELKGKHAVAAKYQGLGGNSFAVVVAADRMTQADFPALVGQLTTTISERLRKEVGATGWVPPQVVLSFQYQNPRWVAMTTDQLTKELGVQRLVFVDLHEFRLHEPGNQYLWKGMASGSVGVVEADGSAPENFAFQDHFMVTYPTKEQALGPAQVTAPEVQVILAKRFADRASWLFFRHDEANSIDY